jgi:hypothetical protein
MLKYISSEIEGKNSERQLCKSEPERHDTFEEIEEDL